VAESKVSANYRAQTFAVSEGSFAAEANVAKYTGCSFTIPANCVYAIEGCAWYLASRPEYVALCTSDTNVNAQLANCANAGLMASVGYVGNTGTNPTTIYLWAKYGGTGTNSVQLSGWYIHK